MSIRPTLTVAALVAIGAALPSGVAAQQDSRGLFGRIFASPTEAGAPRAARPAPAVREVRPEQIRRVEAQRQAERRGLAEALFGVRQERGREPEPEPRQTGVQEVRYNMPIAPTIYHWPVLASSSPSNTRLVISVGDQKAWLLVNEKVALECPVSTARTGKYTPRGDFRMTERVRNGKISTIYDVPMPYWMRLDGTLYGVHAGHLPGYPASAGCIRLPQDAAKVIYENTRSGTRVSIRNSWTPPSQTLADSGVASGGGSR